MRRELANGLVRCVPAVLALALALVAMSCRTPATQLVVVVDTDYAPETELTRVRIETFDERGQRVESREQRISRAGAPNTVTLPFSFGLYPLGNDAQRPAHVVVHALIGLETVPRASARAITRFAPGEARRLTLFISRSCEGVECGEDETCDRSGECQPAAVEVSTLAPVTPGAELTDAGRLESVDAGADAPFPTDLDAFRPDLDATILGGDTGVFGGDTGISGGDTGIFGGDTGIFGGDTGILVDGGGDIDAGSAVDAGRSIDVGSSADAPSASDAGPTTCHYTRHSPCDDPISIWAGGSHTCVATRLGRVRCWGNLPGVFSGTEPFELGGLGPAPFPRAIDGDGSLTSTCVIASDGVHCVGANNGVGALGMGFGGLEIETSPVRVVGLGSVGHVSTNGRTGCAADDSGLYCWGAFDLGALPSIMGTTVPDTCTGGAPCSRSAIRIASFMSSRPQAVAPTLGSRHGCISDRPDAQLLCWGDNSHFQLGDGTTVPRNPVSDEDHPTVDIAITGDTTCVLPDEASTNIVCWGSNRLGLLGVGLTTGPDTCGGEPCSRTRRVHTAGGALQVEGSENGTLFCARGATWVSCWGGDAWGLGDGERSHETCAGPASCATSPVPVMGLSPARPLDIAVGERHACVLLSTGEVRCWGDNRGGQVGVSVGESFASPQRVAGL